MSITVGVEQEIGGCVIKYNYDDLQGKGYPKKFAGLYYQEHGKSTTKWCVYITGDTISTAEKSRITVVKQTLELSTEAVDNQDSVTKQITKYALDKVVQCVTGSTKEIIFSDIVIPPLNITYKDNEDNDVVKTFGFYAFNYEDKFKWTICKEEEAIKLANQIIVGMNGELFV